jgi:hypothetical protein
MTTRSLVASGFVCFAAFALAPAASAQTTAQAPYYAQPAWDQKLPAATRFIVLSNWNGEAVLDRETGLVWERTPATSAANHATDAFNAPFLCTSARTGGRRGWRLPSVAELMSLGDDSDVLPPGHPFNFDIDRDQGVYYTANLVAASNELSHWVVFVNPQGKTSVAIVVGSSNSTPGHAWCVRGPDGGVR